MPRISDAFRVRASVEAASDARTPVDQISAQSLADGRCNREERVPTKPRMSS